MIIEIKGVEFENKGAHLMLCAIIEQLKVRFPNAQIALSPNKKLDFVQCSSLGAWQKLALRKNIIDLNWIAYWLPKVIRRWLRVFGIVTEADIDLMLDASGFSYSDQWPSKIRIYHLKNELERFSKHGKPYIFMPQAFGPFSNLTSIKRIASSFPYAAMINAREQYSYDNLKKIIGDQSNLRRYGDFTNLVEGILPSEDTYKNYVCIVPNKNMVSHRNKDNDWTKRYEPILIKAIAHYRKRRLRPIFLNHEGAEDRELILSLNNQLDHPLEVIEENDPLVIKGIIASATAVFCSRYHGCISALSSGIPCIATSWSHKYEALYEEYGVSNLLLSADINEPNLLRLIDESLGADNRFRERLFKKVVSQKSNSLAMWDEIASIIINDYEQYLQ
ncbi:polysaccharide pyruvyl transferase family protein [Gammaproteobacteria bacterium]|nr:polysaccharide pyruvyl transferase family protein [Gammaproteobacteria bacterium]